MDYIDPTVALVGASLFLGGFVFSVLRNEFKNLKKLGR